jgi:mono/diheme cytochrome c family protein
MAKGKWAGAVLLACGAAAALGCGTSEEPIGAEPPAGTGTATFLPADVQRSGDAQAGYKALLNNPYVACGLPYSIYKVAFGTAPEAMRIKDRDGKNAELPYSQTYFTTKAGVALVTQNCLTCHAGFFEGKLTIGLGDHQANFTENLSPKAELVGGFISNPEEKKEWRKWADRVKALGEYVVAPVRGVNVADNVTAVLIAHRDRKTLAWSQEPLLPLPPPAVVPVDVPPWWRMKKKNAMFYLGQGRGDHSRIMMTASTLCTDSVDEAKAIDAYFPDIRAYILSIEPPKWSHAIDTALAKQGKAVFEATCTRCHGSYGAGGTYPNLRIPLAEVGTDPVLAKSSTHLSHDFVQWYEDSFYGEISDIVPAEGYVAPPLDAVWATAPYLHNGSVPTIEALLDSKKRPKYWTRTFSDTDYDQAALGWRFTAVDHGQAAGADTSLYDTTMAGYANGGHTFGDALTDGERKAVLEYLKTL